MISSILEGASVESKDDATIKGVVIDSYVGNGYNMHGTFFVVLMGNGEITELHYTKIKSCVLAEPKTLTAGVSAKPNAPAKRQD